MTTLTPDVHADVRTSDVRAEVARHRRLPAKGLRLRSPWWLVAMTGGTVSALFALGAVSCAIPQIA